MIPTIIVEPELEVRIEQINQILTEQKLKQDHPNVLWISEEEKLGIKDVRRVIEHLFIKPYQKDSGQVVVLVNGDDLTPEAQNSLLKTLEEPPLESIILIGVSSEERLLPTVLSRCRVKKQETRNKKQEVSNKYEEKIETLLSSKIEDRFQFVEKLKEKEEFFLELVQYFRNQLHQKPTDKNQKFVRELVRMEEYWAQNVNQRAILEYLMLEMP